MGNLEVEAIPLATTSTPPKQCRHGSYRINREFAVTHEGHIGFRQQFVKNMCFSYALSSFSKSPCLYRLMADGDIDDEQAKQSVVLSSMES